MSETDKYTPWEPSIKIYVLAVLVGTILSIVFAGVIFATSSIAVAALMGMIMALFGAFMNENIGEALVVSVIVGGVCGLLFWLGSDPVAKWVGTWAVPAVLGFCSSKIIVGISRNLKSNKANQHGSLKVLYKNTQHFNAQLFATLCKLRKQ